MRGRRQIVPLVLTVLCVLGVISTATIATGATVPALALQQTGHWVLNKALGTVLHVDGGTRQVDAQVSLPPEAARDGMLTVQGATEGYVVGRDRVWVFDKSTLRVVDTQPSAATEVPIAIEVVGGPYLVYRKAGTVVRLGRPPAVGHAGGPLAAPVRTVDGTVWVQRSGDGTVCAFRSAATELDCSLPARPAPGGLTVTHDTATLVDTGADAAQLVANRSLASPVPLDAHLPDQVLLGDRSTGDVLPVVDSLASRLTLVDCGGLPTGRPGAPPTRIELGPGTFSAPVVSGSVIVVLEQTTSRLFTFTPGGKQLSVTQLPAGTDASAIRTGEDGRIYVDEPGGGATRIVQPDGSVAAVPLGTEPGGKIAVAPPTDQQKPVIPPQAGQVVSKPVQRPIPNPVVPPVQGPPVQGPPVQPPAPQPPGQPPPVEPPVADAPLAPTGVAASLAGPVQISVRWDAADGHGLPVRYSVAVIGGPGTASITGTRATISGLSPNTIYSFTVQASSSAGASPISAASNEIATDSVLAAPAGFRSSRDDNDTKLTVTWQPVPGAVSYVVTVRGELWSGEESTTGPEYDDNHNNYCSPKLSLSVRAIGSTGTPGPAASYDVDPTDCTMDPRLTSVVATGPTSVSVQVDCGNPGHGPWINAGVVIRFNGVVKDNGTQMCTHNYKTNVLNYSITGLDPGTVYGVTASCSSPTGTKTNGPASVKTADQ